MATRLDRILRGLLERPAAAKDGWEGRPNDVTLHWLLLAVLYGGFGFWLGRVGKRLDGLLGYLRDHPTTNDRPPAVYRSSVWERPAAPAKLQMPFLVVRREAIYDEE